MGEDSVANKGELVVMSIKCDCCGKVVDIPDEEDEAICPPKDWRRIRTVIDGFVDDRCFNTYTSENAHSCDDCNVHMSVEEHIEAEHEQRRQCIGGGKLRGEDKGTEDDKGD